MSKLHTSRKRKACTPLAAASLLSLCIASPSPRAETSELWGETGELFDPVNPAARLMDWSYAGYAAGESPLPFRPADVDVTEFGAVANDSGDDTAAFRAAIDSLTTGGVVQIPAGTFVIRNQLRLPTGVVLRGAGRGQTTLDIPVSLTAVLGNPGLDAGGTSSYATAPGFIRAQGALEGGLLATVVATAHRGDTVLQVSSTAGFSAGQWIILEQTDVSGTLLKRLHAGLMQPNEGGNGEKWAFRDRVIAVHDDVIELERPLPLDVEARWSPRVLAFAPTVSEVGIEYLTIRFPLVAYAGHFKEKGFNALELHRVANSWIRDVEIVNADNGVKLTGCAFVTAQDVHLTTTGSRGAQSGHHGLHVANGGDTLFAGFVVDTKYIHDVTTTFYATGAVFTEGRGDDLAMDHHSRSPYATLWTDVDVGAGTRPFASSGARSFHPHSAAYTTFWNIRANRNLSLPGLDASGFGFGPRLNFVGLQSSATSGGGALQWRIDAIAPGSLEPRNLWRAMRTRRLGDALTVFAPEQAVASLAQLERKTPSRWDVWVEDGDARLRLNTSVYGPDSGDRLGEHALLPGDAIDEFRLDLTAKTAESLVHNENADYAVVFGYRDADNYFYLLANAGAQLSQVFEVVAGVRTELATAATPLVPDGGWHDLEVTRREQSLVVVLDDNVVLNVVHDGWLPGRLGVGSFNDAVLFDDISAGPPPPVDEPVDPDTPPGEPGEEAPPVAAEGEPEGRAPVGVGAMGGCGAGGAAGAGGWLLLALACVRGGRRARRGAQRARSS